MLKFHSTPTPPLEELVSRAFAPINGVLHVLLIFPPTTVAERYGQSWVKAPGGDLPPLGIATIAAYLREKRYGVGVLDCPALGLTIDQIIDIVRRQDPLVIGISATTFALPTSVKLSERLRYVFPEKLIILGGAHANAVPEDALLHNECFDLVVYGEGELTMRILLEGFQRHSYARNSILADKEWLSAIEGIVYRVGTTVVRTSARAPIMDLDVLPLPARDLLPVECHIPMPNQYRRTPVAHMVVIRGCPYICTFCDQANTRARATSPRRTVEQIENIATLFGIREVSFWDDTMTYNKAWMIEFCERMRAANLDVIWSCYAAIRTLTPEILKLMKEAGCWNIFFGIETGHPELMKNIRSDRKNLNADLIRQVVGWTKAAGIEVRGSFMIALPGETPQIAEENIQFAIELDPEYAQFSITTPFPGTALYDEIRSGKWGRITTDDFSQYQAWNVVFLPDGYKSKAEVWAMERRAMRRFYFRPAFILKKLRGIRSIEDVRRYIKGFTALIHGFAFGPMPDHVREATGRRAQGSPIHS